MNPITMQFVADKYIRLALEEDISSEDVSTNAVMPEAKAGEVNLIAKGDGIIADLGADLVSCGVLTHSAPILDLSLKNLRTTK